MSSLAVKSDSVDDKRKPNSSICSVPHNVPLFNIVVRNMILSHPEILNSLPIVAAVTTHGSLVGGVTVFETISSGTVGCPIIRKPSASKFPMSAVNDVVSAVIVSFDKSTLILKGLTLNTFSSSMFVNSKSDLLVSKFVVILLIRYKLSNMIILSASDNCSVIDIGK